MICLFCVNLTIIKKNVSISGNWKKGVFPMKKIKINKNILKKGKYILITVPVLATIVLSGCSLTPNGDRARYTNTNNDYSVYTNTSEADTSISFDSTQSVTTPDYDLDKLNIPLTDVGTVDLTKIKVNYNNSQNVGFNAYLNNVTVEYDYENIYNFNNSLNEYNKLVLTNSHSSSLNNLDENELYNLIIKNNKEYKKTNNSSIYRELSTKELKDIINIIITTTNDFCRLNSSISIERIKCVLSDLKLFQQKSSMNNAFVTNDNCLIISPNMMKFANTINGEGTKEDVIKHEIIHLLQKGCNCDLEKNENLKRNFGICYGFKNIEINSLDFTWFYEASAEKNMVNYTGHDPLVYKNMIGYLESLSIVNLVKETYKVNDTENLSLKRNLSDLYEYFGATLEEDKKEVLNLMYSIEVMQQAPTDFYELLEKQTGKKKDSTLVDEINYNVKGSACETLTKLFYKNLSKTIVNKELSLGDVFYLISVFENDINNHILYNSPEKYNYNQYFMNKYIEIQDNFFFELSKSVNLSQNELEYLYNSYTSVINKGESNVKNYSLEFLGQDKINYLKEREEAFSMVAAPTIRNVNDSFLEKEIKKVY